MVIAEDPAAGGGGRLGMRVQPFAIHRTILAVDIEGFADRRRTNLDRTVVRRGLYRALDIAFARSGLVWDDFYHEDRGDGLFVLMPADVPKALVVTSLLRELVFAVRGHNDMVSSRSAMRLRAVVHAGEVHHDDFGVVGAAINHAFRLLESSALKTALAASPGVLALIVSDWLFEEVVRHEPASLAETYRRVCVTVKETTTEAWICLPDHPTSLSGIYIPDSGAATVALDRFGVVPRQLPAASVGFVGRASEFQALIDLLDRPVEREAAVVISVVSGMGGVGKTSLAVHWAHRHISHFPDGQLYVNLHGFDPSGSPVLPEVALHGFLEAMGIDPSAIPADADGKAALYRSLVAGRQMLVVLDNARDAAQLGPLLPGTPTVTVVVTSRHQLTSLAATYGARSVDLDVLDDSESRHLLAHHLGRDRMTAEPDIVAELLGHCAGLPLALGILGARAASHPTFPLAVLATELRDVSARLDAFCVDESTANLRTVLSWSYRALDAQSATLFRLLAVAPGPDISLQAAANLVALSLSDARILLRCLESMHLVQQHEPSRYRMHDLVRLYGTEQAGIDCSDETRESALRRLADFYVQTAHRASQMLDRHPPPVTMYPPAPGLVPQSLSDEGTARIWFDQEHPHLLATQQLAARHGWHAVVWHLAVAMTTFHRRRGHLPDQLASWHAGSMAAEHLGLPERTEASVLLGVSCARMGRHPEALDHLRQALAHAGQTGDTYLHARAYQALGYVWELHGDQRQALIHASEALRRLQALDNPVLEANALNGVGWYQARLGDYVQARTSCQAALDLFREYGDRDGEASTLDSLGFIAHDTGLHIDAVGYYTEALVLTREIGDFYEEAEILKRLGGVHADLGNHEDARRVWRQVLDLYHGQCRAADVVRLERQLTVLDEFPSARPFARLEATQGL